MNKYCKRKKSLPYFPLILRGGIEGIKFGTAILLLGTVVFINTSLAQTCTVPPTCESLGFDKSAEECAGLATLKCPLDQSKNFCTAYHNANEELPIAVGDIAYSDGTYSPTPVASKTPVGVVYNTSGLVVALLPYKTDIDDFDSIPETMCSGYTSGGTNNWQNPSKAELQSIYNNRDKINATLVKLLSTTFESGKYIYSGRTGCHNYIDFSTGKDEVESCKISSDGNLRCVNTLAKIVDTSPTALKVGDNYSVNGVAVGKIVEIDSTGQHGIVAFSGGNATGTDASTNCMNKTTGGLNWTLATGEHACQIVTNAGSATGCGYSWGTITCGMHSTSAPGACDKNKWSTCTNATGDNRINCTISDVLTYVCEAPF